MKKSIQILSLLFMLTIVCAFSSSMNTIACIQLNGFRLSSGLNGITYHMDPHNLTSTHHNRIENSAKEWNKQSNKINMTPITTLTTSRIEFWKAANPYGFTIAYTTYVINSQEVVTPNQNYAYARVRICVDEFDKCTNFQQLGATAHEFGHAFGLTECAHNVNPHHIMHQNNSQRNVSVPQSNDVVAVNNLYPWFILTN